MLIEVAQPGTYWYLSKEVCYPRKMAFSFWSGTWFVYGTGLVLKVSFSTPTQSVQPKSIVTGLSRTGYVSVLLMILFFFFFFFTAVFCQGVFGLLEPDLADLLEAERVPGR